MEEKEGCNHNINDLKNHTIVVDNKTRLMVSPQEKRGYCFECGKSIKFVMGKDGLWIEK